MESIAYKNNVTLKTVIFACRFASFVKSVPFEVSSTDRLFKIKYFSKWYQLAPWYAVNWIIFLYAAFQPISFIQNFSRNGWAAVGSLNIAYLLMYMLGALFHGSLYRKPRDFVKAVNGVYELIEFNSGPKLWKVRPWFSRPLVSFCIFYLGAALIARAVVFTGTYVFNSHESRYIFSVLPQFIQERTVVWISSIGLEFMIVLWIFSLLMVTFCYYCAFLFQVIIWIVYLKASISKSRWVRERMKLVKFYRKLQVLFAIHNEYGRDFATGFLVAMGITETLFLYCTLKSYGLVSIHVYWIYPTVAIFIFILMCLLPPTGTIMHRNTNDFIVRLRSQTRKRMLHRVLYVEARSLRAVNTAIGHFCDGGIECSEVVMAQVFNHLLLLLSL